MTNSSDPSVHRQREQQIVEHVLSLLEDDRLRIDTTLGRRPVKDFDKQTTRSDRAADVKRIMSGMNRPDRELQERMPMGETLDVIISKKKWGFMKQVVGRLHVMCVSPVRELVAGSTPSPISRQDTQKIISGIPPAPEGVPTTLVLVSTSGFTLESHELSDRGADRTVILVEPNNAGGWSVTGPVETKALVDLFDPESEEQKRSRIDQMIEEQRSDLTGAGIAADKLAARVQLPVTWVEAQLKRYAGDNVGLTARRLDGRVVLFRESAAPVAAGTTGGLGAGMPLINRMKALFSRKGETEKKIAFLSERRTALAQQRDRAYEEIQTLETRESGLRDQFKKAVNETGKRRITSQLLQLRKELERRQQLIGVLNQQVDVVSTHLHNLELIQQGQTAKLPDTEEMTEDAAKAEEMLAQLQANSEIAGSISTVTGGGLTPEEQALYDELNAEVTVPVAEARQATGSASTGASAQPPPAIPSPPAHQDRAEPEAG